MHITERERKREREQKTITEAFEDLRRQSVEPFSDESIVLDNPSLGVST